MYVCGWNGGVVFNYNSAIRNERSKSDHYGRRQRGRVKATLMEVKHTHAGDETLNRPTYQPTIRDVRGSRAPIFVHTIRISWARLSVRPAVQLGKSLTANLVKGTHRMHGWIVFKGHSTTH